MSILQAMEARVAYVRDWRLSDEDLSLASSMPNAFYLRHDSNALNKLKYQVGQNADQQGLRQVAQQLEGIFVQMMLRHARCNTSREHV